MFPKANSFTLFCLFTSFLVLNCHLTHADRYNRNNNRGDRPGNHDQNRNRPNKPSDHRDPDRNTEDALEEDMKRPLGRDDFEKAKNLDQRLFAVNDKVLYAGKHFEGDIAEDLLSEVSDEKNAISNRRSHWPNGRVPYVISRDFSGEERAVIARAIEEYHSKTCVRFEPYSGSEPNYVHLVRGSGCSSRVGMVGGVQEVTLGEGCVTVGIVEHELMHALGFVHEQSRTDRDQFIRVNYRNIKRGLEQNFRKYSVEEITSLNEPYDYGSVLHYGPTAFSNGNGPTIEPIERGAEIGQRVGFSRIDLAKINKLYRCNGRPGGSSDRNRPDAGSFGTHVPGSSHRPDRERPDSGSLNKPDRPGFGGSGYRPGEGYRVTSTHRPSIIDGIFGGFHSTLRPTFRPGHGHRPDGGDHQPDGGSHRPDGGSHRPDHGHNQGHRPSSRPDFGGFRPSTVDPDNEYELGGGSRYSTRRPSGFDGYSSTYRPYKETGTEHIRPSYISTHRPYGSSRPDYENGFGNNRRPITSPYETTSTFRPFGGANGGNIGSTGNGISSIFGGRLPGSSIIEAIRPGGGNSNGVLGGLGGNRGSSLISSFLRPDRRNPLISGLLGQNDQENQSTPRSPSDRN